MYKESILVAASSTGVNTQIRKLTIGPGITVYMIDNTQEKLVYIRLSV